MAHTKFSGYAMLVRPTCPNMPQPRAKLVHQENASTAMLDKRQGRCPGYHMFYYICICLFMYRNTKKIIYLTYNKHPGASTSCRCVVTNCSQFLSPDVSSWAYTDEFGVCLAKAVPHNCTPFKKHSLLVPRPSVCLLVISVCVGKPVWCIRML